MSVFSRSGKSSDLFERATSWMWLLATGLAVWFFSFHSMRNADLWWHLAAGRWILAHHAIPRADPFSFTTQGSLWLNHEWLSDVIYSVWTSLGGVESLVYWYWGTLLVTFIGLYALCRRLGASHLSSYLAVCLAAATAATFFELRPHLYSLLLYVCLLGWVLPRPRFPSALPGLFLLWVNLHSSFVFGLLVLAAILGMRSAFNYRRSGGSLRAVWKEQRRDLLIAVLCFLACLINPFGIGSFSFPLRYAFDSESPFRELKEWLPPFSAQGVSSPFFPWMIGLFVLACLVLLSSRRVPESEKAIRWSAAGLGALTLLMALRSARFIPLFAISAALLSAQLLRGTAFEAAPTHQRTKKEKIKQKAGESRRPFSIALPMLFAAAALVLLARYPLGERAFPHLTTLETFPVDTLDFIVQNDLSGRMLAYFGWGGYLHYRTGGRMKAYIDSRADTVYKAKTFNDYRRVQYLHPGWMDVVESSGAEYFLWLNLETPQVQNVDQPRYLLATGRWRKLHEDYVSVLLVRNDVRLPARLEDTQSYQRELVLGGMATRSGDQAGAEAHFREALRQNPNSILACSNLALTLAWQDRVSEALALEEHCQDMFPRPEDEARLKNYIEERGRYRPSPA